MPLWRLHDMEDETLQQFQMTTWRSQVSESGFEHEKSDLGLPEAFHERHMCEFGGESGAPWPLPSPEKKLNEGFYWRRCNFPLSWGPFLHSSVSS